MRTERKRPGLDVNHIYMVQVSTPRRDPDPVCRMGRPEVGVVPSYLPQKKWSDGCR